MVYEVTSLGTINSAKGGKIQQQSELQRVMLAKAGTFCLTLARVVECKLEEEGRQAAQVKLRQLEC